MQEIFDAGRHLFVLLWTWAFLPCILTSLTAGERIGGGAIGTGTAIGAELHFRAYRLQQYETTNGRQYGSRAWRVLYEAVALNRSALRKCVVVPWRELLDRDLETSIGAAVALVVIPEDVNALLDKNKQEFLQLEAKFANFRTEHAVYFAPSSESLKYLLKSVSSTAVKSSTAFQQLYNTLVANSFQITSENTATSNAVTTKLYNIVGELNAADPEKPTILVVAHYDSHAVIPALANGYDSNGSGMAALLEILAILSQLYSSSRANRPNYNVKFLLTAAGKFGYQGSRQWLDALHEKQTNSKVAFALCLDGLARGDSLNYHVARMPAEGSVSQKLFDNLKSFAGMNRAINLVSKKIVKGAENLAWEHEIYNTQRVHAATLSHFALPTDPFRKSVLDTKALLDEGAFRDNVAVIANALASFIFELDAGVCDKAGGGECSLVGNSLSASRLLGWLDAFATRPRSVAALDEAENGRLVADLRTVVQRYADKTTTAEVTLVDSAIFGITADNLSASVVKPAVFELFLAAIIGVYLFGLYLLAQNAQPALERGLMVIKKIT